MSKVLRRNDLEAYGGGSQKQENWVINTVLGIRGDIRVVGGLIAVGIDARVGESKLKLDCSGRGKWRSRMMGFIVTVWRQPECPPLVSWRLEADLLLLPGFPCLLSPPSPHSFQMLFLKRRHHCLLGAHLKPQRRKLLGSRALHSGRTSE